MVASASVARINVTVSPGGSRSAFVGRHGDAWKVKVAAAPERGAANEDLLEVLAAVLRVRRGDLSILRGHTSRQKVVEVAGLDPGEVERRLSAFSALGTRT
jgi:uncharacterized protein (TIGR00251 family)